MADLKRHGSLGPPVRPLRLRSLHILVKELDRPLHGEAEALRKVMVIAGIGIHLDGFTGGLHGLIKIFRCGQRNAVIVDIVVQL